MWGGVTGVFRLYVSAAVPAVCVCMDASAMCHLVHVHRLRHVDGPYLLEDGSVVDRRSMGPTASDLGDGEFDADGRVLRAAERQVGAFCSVDVY